MADLIKLRRDTKSNWAEVNPVLSLGEPGVEIDTQKIKYGDGNTPWNDLPYGSGVDVITDEHLNYGYYSLVKSGSGESAVLYEVGDKIRITSLRGTDATYYRCCVLDVKKNSSVEIFGRNSSDASRLCFVVRKDTGEITYISQKTSEDVRELIKPSEDSLVYITVYNNPVASLKAKINVFDSINAIYSDSEVSPMDYAAILDNAPEIVTSSATSATFTLPKYTRVVSRLGDYKVTADVVLEIAGYGMHTVVFDYSDNSLYAVPINRSAILPKTAIPVALVKWSEGVHRGNFKEYKYNGNIRKIIIENDNYPTYQSNNVVMSGGLYNAFVKNTNGIFSIRHTTTRSSGKLSVSTADFNATPYINVDYIQQGAATECVVSDVVKIQAFDAEKNFIGLYNDFAAITSVQRVRFSFDKEKLPANTQYIRMCSNGGTGFIDGVPFTSENVVKESEYAICKDSTHHRLAWGFTKIYLNDNFYDYDYVTVNRLPTFDALSNEQFSFYGWKDGEVARIWRVKTSAGIVEGHKFYYNDSNIILEYDYDKSGYNDVVYAYTERTAIELTKNSFSSALYAPVSEYVKSEKHTDIANTFTFVQYTTNEIKDITVQRFPKKELALAPDSTEYFCFYTWKDGKNVKSIYCYIRDAVVSGNIITYKVGDIEFVVDYSSLGEGIGVGDIRKTDIELTSAAFKIVDQSSGRYDIVGKQYVNLSSSTFSSGWHQECIENLGMVYNQYGMGGSSHGLFDTAHFNLNYQDADVAPGVDRNTLNMVAKLCTDNANNGFYPDIIVSCCVLNDCYISRITAQGGNHYVIGTFEEAMQMTMPELRMDTAEHVTQDFSEFFESEDTALLVLKRNSMGMMRLVIELLSKKFPFAQIIVSSSQQILNETFDQEAIAQFNVEQEKLCKHYAIPYIRLNDECGINTLTIPTFLASDKLHPNAKGNVLYKNYLSEQLKQRITLKK